MTDPQDARNTHGKGASHRVTEGFEPEARENQCPHDSVSPPVLAEVVGSDSEAPLATLQGTTVCFGCGEVLFTEKGFEALTRKYNFSGVQLVVNPTSFTDCSKVSFCMESARSERRAVLAGQCGDCPLPSAAGMLEEAKDPEQIAVWKRLLEEVEEMPGALPPRVLLTAPLVRNEVPLGLVPVFIDQADGSEGG